VLSRSELSSRNENSTPFKLDLRQIRKEERLKKEAADRLAEIERKAAQYDLEQEMERRRIEDEKMAAQRAEEVRIAAMQAEKTEKVKKEIIYKFATQMKKIVKK